MDAANPKGICYVSQVIAICSKQTFAAANVIFVELEPLKRMDSSWKFAAAKSLGGWVNLWKKPHADSRQLGKLSSCHFSCKECLLNLRIYIWISSSESELDQPVERREASGQRACPRLWPWESIFWFILLISRPLLVLKVVDDSAQIYGWIFVVQDCIGALIPDDTSKPPISTTTNHWLSSFHNLRYLYTTPVFACQFGSEFSQDKMILELAQLFQCIWK